MNKTLKLVIAVAVAALCIGVFAQPGGGGGRQGGGMMMGGRGGGGPASIVNRTDVQADIKITEEQKTKLSDLQRKQREEMRAAMGGGAGGGGAQGGGGRGGFGNMSEADREKMMKEFQARAEKNEKEVFAILTPEQVTRVKQIYVQLQGNRIVTDEKYQKELGFTDAQKAKVKSLQDGQREAMTTVMERMRNGEIERDELTSLMEKNNKIMDEELGKVLTAVQKDKLKAMSGAPFKATDQPRQGGRGGGN